MTQEAADTGFMALALAQAQRARTVGEVPVGAVVVRDGQVIGVGHNLCIGGNDMKLEFAIGLQEQEVRAERSDRSRDGAPR